MTELADRTGTAMVDDTVAPERRRPTGLAAQLARPGTRDGLGLAGTVLALAFLWGRGRHVWYWIDEGISIGISSHPLTRIPGLLRHDGAPPLYYALLHFWIRAFGTSESATHSLSLAFALAVVPVALWAGWSLFGRRAGWIAVGLVALNPFIGFYANETRMYTLVVLLGFAATALFLHAIVFGRRQYLPGLAVCVAFLLYTHNWALFVALAMGVAVLVRAALQPDRATRQRTVVDGLLALGGAALLYVPWLPTLAYQLVHTGAPFSLRPTLLVVRGDLMSLFGGPDVVIVVGLACGVAFMDVVRPPWDGRAVAVIATTSLVVVVVAVGWMISRNNSVWVYRYLAVVVGPIILIVAVGLSQAGRFGVVALGVVFLLSVPVGIKGQLFDKSNVADVAAKLGPGLGPGDLVMSDFGRLPVLAHYLPGGLAYAETIGPVLDPLLSDQRNATRRLRKALPGVTLAPSLDSLAPGQHVLVVCSAGPASLDATQFLQLNVDRCQEALDLPEHDARFRLDATVTPASLGFNPVEAHLFTRVASPGG